MKLHQSIITSIILLSVTPSLSTSNNLEEIFLAPKEQHKLLIIWQWMDGLVTKEGITCDLEAFKEAGLAGVQNFQIGGPGQLRIGNPKMQSEAKTGKNL